MALLTPSAGIWLNGDFTPTTSTLTDKPCLIDADKSTECTVKINGKISVGLNLGSSKTVTSIIIYFMVSSGTLISQWLSGDFDGFSIYTSNDNSSWTLRQEWDNPTLVVDAPTLAHVELELSTPVAAQYVKVWPKDNGWYCSGVDYLKVAELEAYAESTTIQIPVAAITIAACNEIQIFPIFPPSSALSITAAAPICGSIKIIYDVALLTLSAEVPAASVVYANPASSLIMSSKPPSYIWSIPANLRPAAQVIYTCTLTGDGESPAVSDLTLPMSSFQGRMRDGDPSYISAVIPNCMVYADDILARQNGDIVIKKGYRFQDGTTQLEEIARVDFESVRIDQGSKSASATISGHKTISSSSVKTITVEGVSYYCLQADGKRRVRALLDLFLRIGDTCVYGTGTSDYLTVGYITYTVSVNQTIMEVTEA